MSRNIARALCLAFALAACGRGGARLETATAALRAGNLDAVEAALQGDGSAAAEKLRAAVRERRAEREVLELRLEEIERELPPDEALAALEALAREAPDPVARERVERAQSKAYDRRVSAASERPRASAAAAPTARPPAPDRPDTTGRATAPDLLDAVRRDVMSSVEAGDWRRGLANLDMALDGAGARADEIRELRRELLHLAEIDMEEAITRALASESEHGLNAALARLSADAVRFPTGGRFDELQRELRDLEGRVEILRLAEVDEEPAAEPGTERDGADPTGPPAQRAQAAEATGDLASAAELWLAAARERRPGLERDALVARAAELERRLELRREIAAAVGADPAGFAELGIAAADERGLTVDGERVGWDRLGLDRLKKAARRARLSSEAEVGLVIERLERGDRGGPSGAWAELDRLRERGLLQDAEVWALVARARGETLPEGGYVFVDGQWIVASEHERAEREALLAALETRLAEADPPERDAAFAELARCGEQAVEALERALASRRAGALRELQRGSLLEQLRRVADERRELDRRREAALELIFDEERYFYPYRQPEVSSEKAAQYWPVQTQVDELVSAVRESWASTRKARLSAGFRAALDELAWTGERALELEAELPSAAELPDWIDGVDPELAEIGLAQFAWDAKERGALAYDRAVNERNERLWQRSSGREPEQTAAHGEAEQVRITNAYRAMLGRRALAWNPRIQAAARMHSSYMADTGDFGHFEPDPERRTPGDRMRLAGYELGVSENCHMGGSGPQGAHDGWTHSSGHHRNLLNAGHREMASSQVGSYWTQNFGADTAFLSELEE